MRKNYFIWLFLLIAFSVNSLTAQTDLSGYLVNAGFDEQIEYTNGMDSINLIVEGDLSKDPSYIGGVREVYGWKKTGNTEWSTSASFGYGYSGTLNSQGVAGRGAAPSSGYNGSTGGALGISTAWTGTVTYAQEIALPVGNYTIEYAAYNSGPVVDDTSLVGWIPSTGDAILSSKSSFAVNDWETDVVNVALTAAGAGNIQVGVTSPNAGSGGVGRIFFDYVKFTCSDVDKDDLTAKLAESVGLISELETNLVDVTAFKATKDALDAAMGNAATDATLIKAAVDFMQEFFIGKYSKELLPLLDEAEEVLGFPGSSTSAKLTLTTTLNLTYQAFENGEIGLGEFPTYIENLRAAIDIYMASITTGLRVHYDFSQVTDNTVKDMAAQEGEDGFDGTLMNEAEVVTMGTYKVLSTGNGTGYLDMGTKVGNVVASMENFTVSAYYRVDEGANLGGDGRFLWAFSSRESNNETQGEYLSLRLNGSLFESTPTGWRSGRQVIAQKDGANMGQATKGEWQHVLYRQSDRRGEYWLNGELVGSIDTMYLMSEAITAPTSYNWIARPPFSADNYLTQTLIYDFRLYNEAIDDSEIQDFAAIVPDLNQQFLGGGGGDYTELTNLIAEATIFRDAMTIGDTFGEYPQTAQDTLNVLILESQALVDAGNATQLIIDPQVTKLQNVLTYVKGLKNAAMCYPEGNTPASLFPFESGLYYIQVGDYFLTMPEDGAYDTKLQLRSYVGNLEKVNNNQVWNIQYDPAWSILSEADDPNYDPESGAELDIRALFAFVSDVTSGWEEGAWHMDEQGRMKTGTLAEVQSSTNANYTWRQHMIYYGSEDDASGNKLYSIVNHHDKATIYFSNIAENAQPVTTTTSKVYQFRFRTIEDVVNELGNSISVNEVGDPVFVYGTQGEVVVSGADAGDAITVYDFSGRVVSATNAYSDESRISVPAGFYIVKVGTVVTKVIVK